MAVLKYTCIGVLLSVAALVNGQTVGCDGTTYRCYALICNETNPSDCPRYYSDQRYNFNLSIQTRQRHFYCPGFGQNGVAGHPDREAQFDRYWTVFFQFPLLSYMDNARKWALFRSLLEIAGGNKSDLNGLCIGNYTQYGVSTYNEGMLLHLYFRDSNTPVAQYAKNMNANCNINSGLCSKGFNDKPAINIETYWLEYSQMPNDSAYFLARPRGKDLTADKDPTLNAVFIGSWAGYRSLEQVLAEPGLKERFAANPKPINYGIEVGDYFFAVLGSILVFLLLVVIVFGFIIHPMMDS